MIYKRLFSLLAALAAILFMSLAPLVAGVLYLTLFAGSAAEAMVFLISVCALVVFSSIVWMLRKCLTAYFPKKVGMFILLLVELYAVYMLWSIDVSLIPSIRYWIAAISTFYFASLIVDFCCPVVEL